jgi:DNA-binding IclR family transcriptional regulator
MQILSLFSIRKTDLGVSEVSRELKLPKATVHGLLRTLVDEGFVNHDASTRRYCLGLRIYELGIIMSGTLEINQKASGPAHQLSRQTKMISRVAIWDGDSVVITLTEHPRPRAALPHQIGPRVNAYCTAVGKAVLAFLDKGLLEAYLERTRLEAVTPSTIMSRKQLLKDLDETRYRGYSLDREEAIKGMGCLGAPIWDKDDRLAGAISLSGQAKRILGDQMDDFAGELLRTAADISRYMGFSPPLSRAGTIKSRSW